MYETICDLGIIAIVGYIIYFALKEDEEYIDSNQVWDLEEQRNEEIRKEENKE